MKVLKCYLETILQVKVLGAVEGPLELFVINVGAGLPVRSDVFRCCLSGFLSADWTLLRLLVRFSVIQVMCCVVVSWTFTSHLRGFFTSSQEIELKSSCLQ